MPLPVSASDVTETVKNAASANGSVAQAIRAAAGGPVKASRTAAIPARPVSAIATVVRSSAVARSIGFAPLLRGPSIPAVVPTGVVSAHTGGKTTITVSGVNYDLYTFLNVGTNTFVVSDLPITVDIFVLGGGGGGYRYNSGRGGSFTVVSNVTLTPRSYTLTVGGGGGGGRVNLGQYGSPGGSSSITVSGTTYTGAGGSDGGGVGTNPPGPTSDFTGVTTNYGGQGANGGTPGAGGGGTFGAGMFGSGGSGTNGLGGGGGAVHDDMNWGGSGGSGRVMIRIRK